MIASRPAASRSGVNSGCSAEPPMRQHPYAKRLVRNALVPSGTDFIPETVKRFTLREKGKLGRDVTPGLSRAAAEAVCHQAMPLLVSGSACRCGAGNLLR